MTDVGKEEMLIESSVLIQPGDVAQIVESVFETMLNLQATENGAPWSADENRVTASVHLSGDWNGAVLIECDRGQACRFAGRFLSMDPPESLDDDSRDVLGELANMIGGNLKSILTPGIRLSMPSVVDGSSFHMRVCGGAVTLRLTFQCEEGTFWVTVVTMDPPESGPPT
jgi:chemotaxis protein CheX